MCGPKWRGRSNSPGLSAARSNCAPPTPPAAWRDAMQPMRDRFHREVIGQLPTEATPLNPRARVRAKKPGWTEYDVELDVRPDVIAWGILLVPTNLAPGERRPVVI